MRLDFERLTFHPEATLQKFRWQNILGLNLAALVGLSALGCDNTPNGAPNAGSSAGDVGSVQLALQAAPGVTVNTFSYAITGPKSYSGSIDVSSSSTVSTVIGGIAIGSGYSLTLTGTSTDGQTNCSGGSATFSVAAHATTSVSVAIDCHGTAKTGSVLVNGTINVCPAIDSVSAPGMAVLSSVTMRQASSALVPMASARA